MRLAFLLSLRHFQLALCKKGFALVQTPANGKFSSLKSRKAFGHRHPATPHSTRTSDSQTTQSKKKLLQLHQAGNAAAEEGRLQKPAMKRLYARAVAAGIVLAIQNADAFALAPNRALVSSMPSSLMRCGLEGRLSQAAAAPRRSRRVATTMQAMPVVELAGAIDAVQAQVAALTMDDVAGGLFAFSLFPYLGFLYHLGQPENNTPKLGLFGFKFLLAFVAVSIPAAIAAKVLYGAQLADVDFLHGGAESFLALTNLFIVLGFRRAVAGTPGYKDAPVSELLSSPLATVGALVGTLVLMAQGLPAFVHPEPANALSFPT